MGLFLESWLAELVLLGLVLAGAVYKWFQYRYTYWTRQGVVQAEPVIPFGNIAKNFFGQRRMELVLRDLYWQFRGEKYIGVYAFHNAALLLTDPDIIRMVLIKDFSSFVDRSFTLTAKESFSHNVFDLSGNKWRRLRSKLSPTFTSGKLKMMSETMQDCGAELLSVLREPARRGQVVEMREVSARFTTDIIASVAFGIESHCQREPDAEFRRYGRCLFEPDFRSRLVQTLATFLPTVSKTLQLSSQVDIVFEEFRKIVKETVEYREKNGVVRNDFMHLMIQLKNKGFIDDEKENDDNWKLPLDVVAAQAFLFYGAGFETTSSTMSAALYELALNPEVQRRLHQEVDAALRKNDGKLTYDAIAGMHYLDKVVAETLRMYPPAAVIDRKCARRYKFPDGPEIEEGTVIFISLSALHYDPKYFPDPLRFDPERFSEEQKSSRHPMAYLPFGDGPRNCLGMRLGLLQSKIGIAHIMSQFEVQQCDETQVPLDFRVDTAFPVPQNGIKLRLVERK